MLLVEHKDEDSAEEYLRNSLLEQKCCRFPQDLRATKPSWRCQRQFRLKESETERRR
jgi:hypothetical protein